MGFIYVLTSPSGKSYVGQTARAVSVRVAQHCGSSRACTAIRRAIDKYGIEAFKITSIEVPNEMLNKLEKHTIETMNTLAPNGYNLSTGGDSNYTLSEETRAKMREAKLGIRLSDETKMKIGLASRGHRHTQETKDKMRASHVGKPLTLQQMTRVVLDSPSMAAAARELGVTRQTVHGWVTRGIVRAEGPLHGARDEESGAGPRERARSEETRAKISAAMKGHRHSQETKDKISATMKARRQSQETNDKTSASHIGKPLALEQIHRAVRESPSMAAAARELGVRVRTCLR